jgi:Rieske Fe-S protein
VIAKVSDVPVGGADAVVVNGRPVWLLQLTAGQFTAYSAICPHEGCTVQFVSGARGFACPCHRSQFDARGRVLNGPAPANLSAVRVASDGTSVFAQP